MDVWPGGSTNNACVEVLLLVPPERGVSRVFAPLLAPWKTPWAPVFRSLDGSTSSAGAHQSIQSKKHGPTFGPPWL